MLSSRVTRECHARLQAEGGQRGSRSQGEDDEPIDGAVADGWADLRTGADRCLTLL